MGDTVNLSARWAEFWAALTTATGIGGVITLLAIVGMLLVVGGVIGWLFKKRRGGSGQMTQGMDGLLITILIGGILVAPRYGIQVLLVIVDVICNAVLRVLGLGGS